MGTGCPAPGHSAMLPSDQTARPACRERCVKPSSKNKPSCQNCAVMRLRLSCANNHCQNRFSACVCVCVFVCICVTLSSITVISLQTALGSCETYSSLKPSCGNRFTFRLKHTHWHIHNCTQTRRPLHANTKRKNLTSGALAQALLWEVGVTSIALR